MNIHTTRTSNGSIQAIYHVPTPAGTNEAGVSWKDCVCECPEYPKETSAHQKDDLPGIKAGEIVEYQETYQFSAPDLTDAEKKAELDARYLVVKDRVQAEIQKKLKYYGAEKDV